MAFRFNPITGQLDIVGASTGSSDNFSYETVPIGDTVTIPINQQMIVNGVEIVEGTLIVIGSLVVFS